ncbi:MAG: hypothetical protein PHI06_11290 [Desulfobulbaceae bacterium]|nr:hypothetical protein [Desulfobulbaceae bacterium]
MACALDDEILSLYIEGGKLVKPNYQYEKRQRDLAKKKKKEEKRLASLEKKRVPAENDVDTVDVESFEPDA